MGRWGCRVQERVVALLVIVLVVATAATAVSVNLLRPANPSAWNAFELSVGWSGSARVGSSIVVNVTVRQGTVDPKTLWLVYLSLDVSSLQVTSGTPPTNPWNCATAWNLTTLDLSAPHTFTVTAIATQAGQLDLHAMIWVPRGDLRAVPIDSTGSVNPAGVSLMQVDSESVWIDAAA